jgi:hypothetical protein
MKTKLLCLGVLAVVIAVSDVLPKAESVSIFASVPGLSGFAAGKDGSIFALSATNNNIIRFAQDGSIMQTIGPVLDGNYSLQISRVSHPFHVDDFGRIYIPSNGYLFILDSKGHILNLDSSNKYLDGFHVGYPTWIGTTKQGNIYVHPAIKDENSLISVITPEGTHLQDFGDPILSRSTLPHYPFRMTLAADGTLYAVSSRFPAMLKYNSDQSFNSLIRLHLGALQQVIDSHDIPLEDFLRNLAKGQPSRENYMIFTDAVAFGDNSLICVSSNGLLWYTTSGQLYRELNQFQLIDLVPIEGRISNVIIGCNGGCLLGRVQLGDKVYKFSI